MTMTSLSGDSRLNEGLSNRPATAVTGTATFGRVAFSTQTPVERMGTAMLVIALQASIVAVVMFSRMNTALEPGTALAAFDVPNASSRERISHPARPRTAKAVTQSAPIRVPAPDFSRLEIAQPPAGAPPVDAAAGDLAVGETCDLTQPVQDALRQSAELRRHLPDIPADRRSIANAIAIWNAEWMDPGAASAQAAFAAIRQTITRTVLASPANCRSQIQAGPRLIYLPGESGEATVLALGSGRWTWQQVAGGLQPLPGTGVETGPAPSAQFLAMRGTPPLVPALPAAMPSGNTPALDVLLASLTRKRSPSDAPFTP